MEKSGQSFYGRDIDFAALAVSILANLTLIAAIVGPVTAFATTAQAETIIEADKKPYADVFYRTVTVNNVEIAYREAGDPDNPTILLLHGFPTSSQMFRNLIPELAARYHVLAPDYPGYGASEMPDRDQFDYSFANFADVIDGFVEQKGVSSFALYLMDYGAPVGYRVFAKDPRRVSAFIIQNGNAYEEGLRDFWKPIKAYWNDPNSENRETLRGLLTIEATHWQYTHGVGDVSKISPDTWHTDQYLLDRPGNSEIQLDMFLSYATNVSKYPGWQKLFREHQPPALVVWGQNDEIFPADGAHPYKRDLKNLEFHLLDTGHFALEEYGDVIADEMLDFLDREIPRN